MRYVICLIYVGALLAGSLEDHDPAFVATATRHSVIGSDDVHDAVLVEVRERELLRGP